MVQFVQLRRREYTGMEHAADREKVLLVLEQDLLLHWHLTHSSSRDGVSVAGALLH